MRHTIVVAVHPETSWDWLAVSLNPYFEGNDAGAMIGDDALMKQTLDHWCFGKVSLVRPAALVYRFDREMIGRF